MSKTIGVIGLGSIGMRHAKNLLKLGHRVLAVDTNEAALATARNAGAATLRTESADETKEFFANAAALVVASPTGERHNHTPIASRLGCHLFVEKPIGVDIEHAGSVTHILNTSGKKIMVGTNLRFHECVQQAQDWIAEGLLGQPLWANLVCAQYNDKPAYLRDGVILNWGAHEIDLALYLLGPAKVAASSTRLTDGKDDLTDIILEHDNGCRSTIHLDYLTKPEVRQTIIVGEKATIIMDLVGRQAWLRDARGGVIDAFVAQDSWDQNYMDEMRAFIDRIDGKDTLGATGEDGLRALEICLEVRKQAGLA